MKRIVFTIASIISFSTSIFAQKEEQSYNQYYPIGESPFIKGMSPYKKNEGILFYAQPIVRYSLYNNIQQGLINEKRKHSQAWYVSFMPQVRMFTFDSNPVVMPSYTGYLGTQHMVLLPNSTSVHRYFVGGALESGIYFNGQTGCPFRSDDSNAEKSDCAIHLNANSKLSDLLNREDGKLNVASSRLILNFRIYDMAKNEAIKQSHSFNLGYVRWHKNALGFLKLGSSSIPQIKNLLGVNRFLFQYEYQRIFNNKFRVAVKENTEYIQGAHKSLNPYRSETMLILYPFKNTSSIGFFGSYIYGHDDYNLRVVDSGNIYSFGIRWSQFPPLKL